MTDQNDDERFNATESAPNITLLNKSEIDMQIATARAYPRSIKQFMAEATSLVMLDDDVAESCSYALPRKSKDKDTGQWVTKNIEGPSARFAEIVLSCWGHARAGTRIVDEGPEFVTAQGFMFDLQKNVAIQIDVPRRITDSQNRRYKTDMIGVTANAAASIALRNAILKVVPKALWYPIYEKARATALGNEMTLSNKRLAALDWFQKKGASKETIFEHFNIKGVEDMTLDHIATLLGYKTSLREGDTTVEALFDKADPAGDGKSPARSMADLAAKAPAASAPPPAPAPAAGADDAPKAPEVDALLDKIKKAKNQDALDTHIGWVTAANYPDEAVRLRLNDAYEARKAELAK